MRFAFLLFLSASAGLLAGARSFPELYGRSTTDTCASVNAELVVTDLKFHSHVSVGFIDFCFCLSDIPDLLKTQPVAIEAAKTGGASAATAALTALVNECDNHKKCTYPDHSVPACSLKDPCGFTCKDGFIPAPLLYPTECICKEPARVCNGVCGLFPGHSCPSGKPKKRELELQYKRAACDKGLTVCGVYGFDSAEAWECVDTRTDLESCGGCMVPFGRTSAHGVDCTAIIGVMDVACAAGSCVVHRCLPGYIVSLDGSYCVRMTAQGKEILASQYGLEHVPLKRESEA